MTEKLTKLIEDAALKHYNPSQHEDVGKALFEKSRMESAIAGMKYALSNPNLIAEAGLVKKEEVVVLAAEMVHELAELDPGELFKKEPLAAVTMLALRHLDDDQISHLAYSLLERIPADKWPAGLVKKEEWIDVRERMPDFDEPVLWLFEDGRMNVLMLDKDGNPWLKSTTHWQPLPAPPSQLKK